MKLINVSKIYHNKNNTVVALNNINICFGKTGLTTILGPSGCGKTTLLNIISGNGKNFDGQIVDIPQIDYVTQDFMLFENMSILDNLKIVKNDIEEIKELLIKFNLWEHRNKKVLKCSNGQKKRIQFIRAILHNPDLILCDEPTAALDHDNAELLMNVLKDISKDILVIIVTHDIALSEKYADRIIKMGKGIIETDIARNKYTNDKIVKVNQNKNLFETFKLCLFQMKSRLIEHTLLAVLFFLASFVLFVSINLYQNIMEQYSYLGVFKNGTNVIVSSPKNSKFKTDAWGMKYLEFDHIQYQDLLDIVNDSNEIIGVEAFYDFMKYENNMMIEDWVKLTALDYTIFKDVVFPISLDLTGTDEPYYGSDKPLGLSYMIGNDLNELITNYEKQAQTHYYIGHLLGVPENHDYYRKNFGVSIIDTLNHKEISLLYGEYPSGNNEVILAKDTAELLMKQDGYHSLEEMIGKKFYIGVESEQNNSVGSDYYSACRMNGIQYVCYRTEDMRYVDRFEVTISGISNIETNNANYIFFVNNVAKNPIIDYYVDHYENLYFDYAKIILKPEANTTEFIQRLNLDYPMADSEYKAFNRLVNDGIPLYKKPSTFIVYWLTAFVLFMLIIVVFYVFIRNRFIKEHKIMNMLGYSTGLEKYIHVSLITLSSILIFVLSNEVIFKYVNKLASYFEFSKIMTMEIDLIILSYFVVFIIHLMVEIMLGGVNHVKDIKCK